MFEEFLECFGSFWNVSGVLEYVSEVLECFESFWHMSGVSGMFREFLECITEFLEQFLACFCSSGMFRELLAFSWSFWNVR